MTLEYLKLFFYCSLPTTLSFWRKFPAHYSPCYLTSKLTVTHGVWS